MPDDDTTAVNAADTSNRHVSSNKGSGSRSWRDLFAIPPPVKRVFDKVPLVTYEANELPARAPRDRGENVLYVFTTEDDAQNGRPSFNPSCLRWQVCQGEEMFRSVDWRQYEGSARSVLSMMTDNVAGILEVPLPALLDSSFE